MKTKDFVYITIIVILTLLNLLQYNYYGIYRRTIVEYTFYTDKLAEVGSIASEGKLFDAKMRQKLSPKYKITGKNGYYNLMPLGKRNVTHDFGIYITTDKTGKIISLGRDKP